ncbi:MAG TPA: Gfo/Idh/MocA family oxidoreductase [Gemmataceae bacterium]|nr:Gfo/Idh/MocA family oxidoreductase [Gemmataceae bacterium]
MAARYRKDSRAVQARKTVRYAVVGLGWIAQEAVLPAFAHARENSELVALVSGDPDKRQQLGGKYGVEPVCSYEDYDACLQSDVVDAVYIALPNTMHREYTERAAAAGVHVLCEKPMAVTEEDCEAMIRACRDNDVRLMIAYRLHFEEANLKAIDIVQGGELGDPRLFNSVFTQQVRAGNIRVRKEMAGGTLDDMGVYCINAARYLFRDEPVEVVAVTARSGEERFREVEEMTSAVLRFPHDRLATFTCSFGAAPASSYEVLGTKGSLRLDPAYTYKSALKHRFTVEGKTSEQTFAARDQFAAELIAFSDCVLSGTEPEPDGCEGLADVRIVRALYRSAEEGRPVELPPFQRTRRPTLAQEIQRPPVQEPPLLHAAKAPGKP